MKNRPPLTWELPPDELAGTSGARLFYALSIGKANSPQHPYCVANEKIASELGRAIGLRVTRGAFVSNCRTMVRVF